MIKFFRHIRKSLLEQNKMGKYLKYAIGEILLVMIGILLALQVSNWNDKRLNTVQEVKILSELKNDLQANLQEVQGTYDNTKEREHYTALVLDYLKQKKPVDDSLKFAFEVIQNDGLFNNANTAYEYIKNQGVDILSNDSLRIRITEMYERQFSNITVRENLNWQFVYDVLHPLMDKHLKSTLPIASEFTYALAINSPKNMAELHENETFKNIIVRLQNWLRLRLRWQDETIKSLNQLITDVEKEIEQLES